MRLCRTNPLAHCSLQVCCLDYCWQSPSWPSATSWRVRNFPYSPPSALEKRALLQRTFWALPSLLMPVFIVITLRFGIATPTEVSIIACAYAVLVSGLIYRDLTWRRIYTSILSSGVITGVIMLVIMGSAPMGWIMIFDDIPSAFADWA